MEVYRLYLAAEMSKQDYFSEFFSSLAKNGHVTYPLLHPSIHTFFVRVH